MIHSISVENFYSISDKQTLDFRSSGIKIPEGHCKLNDDDKHSLPCVIGFFGANASGKTTILRAITSVIDLIIASSQNQLPNIGMLFQAYRSKEWWNKPTKISIELNSGMIINKNPENEFLAILKYDLEIENNPEDFQKKIIKHEKLSYKFPKGKYKKLLERNYKTFSFGEDFDESGLEIYKTLIDETTATIGRLALFNHRISKYLLKQAKFVNTNIFGLIKILNSNDRVQNHYATNRNHLDKINEEIQKFDLGITQMKIVNELGNNLAIIDHVGLDMPLFINEESQGTQKFITLFPFILSAIETGGITIIDELDTDLHPLIIPEILSWFYDETRNPNKAQLLFTAHNSSIMNYMDRRQIYLTEKPMGKGTQIYCAADVEGLRPENNIAKKYLGGELGGVPIIG